MANPATLDQYLHTLRNYPEQIEFTRTLELIERIYRFEPCAFHNATLLNRAGENAGSCRVFAFARLQGLSQQETLACFGEHYRHVLADPAGTDHRNIRTFMVHGWPGIRFEREPLTPRGP